MLHLTLSVRDWPAYLRVCCAVDGLRARHVAELAGVTPAAVSHWMGKNKAWPTEDHVRAVAAVVPSMDLDIALALYHAPPLRLVGQRIA